MSEYYDCIIIGAGPALIERIQKQAVNFRAEVKTSSKVTALKTLQKGNIEVRCDKNKYIARAVIPAPSSHIRNTGNNVEKE